MRLSELKTGDKGVVVKVLGHGGFRKRIVEMGFVKGKSVEVLLNAPLKDPVKYRIMGYEISLRRSEAEMIEVVSRDDVALNDELLRTDDGNYAPTVVEAEGNYIIAEYVEGEDYATLFRRATMTDDEQLLDTLATRLCMFLQMFYSLEEGHIIGRIDFDDMLVIFYKLLKNDKGNAIEVPFFPDIP